MLETLGKSNQKLLYENFGKSSRVKASPGIDAFSHGKVSFTNWSLYSGRWQKAWLFDQWPFLATAAFLKISIFVLSFQKLKKNGCERRRDFLQLRCLLFCHRVLKGCLRPSGPRILTANTTWLMSSSCPQTENSKFWWRWNLGWIGSILNFVGL